MNRCLVPFLLAAGWSSAAAQADSFTVRVAVPAEQATLRGLLRVAAGPGPHPTVVFLHGFPGNEDPALASYLQGQGFNAMAVMFRGARPSDGSYTVAATARDAGAMVAFLRSDSARRAYRADPSRIAVIGASAGSYAALRSAGADPALRCVGAIVPFNWAVAGMAGRSDSAVRRQFDAVARTVSSGNPPRIRLDSTFVNQLLATAETYDLAAAASALGGRRVFLLGAERDASAEPRLHFHPAVAAARSAGAVVRDTMVTDGHTLPDTWQAAFGAIVRWLRTDCWG
jgi:pimeloyl-ACP methyl ester carboxylesterase